MSAEDSRLLEVAGCVSDGRSVDWGREGRPGDAPNQQRILRGMRLVASVARAYRELGEAEAGQAGSPAVAASPETALTLSAVADARGSVAAEKAPGQWGPLRILGRIGSGGFGDVYRAWDPRLERAVALKLLRPSAADRAGLSSAVIEEGRLLARVHHSNVVTVFGADRHDGRVGLWMELVSGLTLAAAVRAQGPFAAREAALIGIELCHALAAIHAAGLLHRDIKAQNVMREAGGRIVLMDLGAGVDRGFVAAAQGETITGTPLYMAPEVLAGQPATARSDLYSLGTLLFYLATGSHPLEASSFGQLLEMHRRGERRLLRDVRPDLPDAFVRVVERTLAHEPPERYASAGEMERDLVAALGMQKDREPAVPRAPVWRRAVVFAGAPLAVALVLFLATRLSDLWRSGPTFKVEAAFRRETPEGSERLLPGARIAPQDRLFLEFRASGPVHLYVINQDERGASYLLFPLPDFELKNPLAANVMHRLPGRQKGRDKEINWLVSTAGGREHFVLVASPQRLAEFEQAVLALARPSAEPRVAVQLDEGATRQLRGVGGLVEAESAAAGGQASRLFEMAARLGSEAEGTSGVWVRQFDLENPAP